MEIAKVFGSRYRTNVWRSTVIINSSFLHIEDIEPKQSFYRKNTTVKLSVSYPSKTVNKTLPKHYEALGKSLIHGPPSCIATAVLKCAPLTHLVIEKVLRLLKAEVGDLCSKKNPSSLRNCTKDALINFELEKLCNEWKERAPLFTLSV